MRLSDVLPAARWARGYRRADIVGDLRAAAIVGVLLVPQAMAYAVLAGMPPITGLYAALAALFVYAVLGSSAFTNPGPAAIDALLVASAVGPLADGDPDRYVALAAALAVLSGGLQLLGGLLRLGALVGFISVPVVIGFSAAAALTITASQLRGLAGIAGGPPTSSFVRTVEALVERVGEVDPRSLGVGVACVLAILLLRSRLPRWLPAPLVVLVVATAIAALTGLRGHLVLTGAVPGGLPGPSLPAVDAADLRALLPSAAALALVSYLETVSAGSSFARRVGGRIEPNGELVAIGGGNLAAGLLGGFPVASGFARTAVAFQAGARTPMTALLAAAVVAAALLTLSPVLALLPTAALAAVIIVAVATLVDLRGVAEVARVRRSDLVALLATFAVTAAFGPVTGIGVGVAVSLVLLLRQSARPHFPELGRVPGTARYRSLARHDPLAADPAVLLMRLDAPLYFGNAVPVVDRIVDKVARRPGLAHVVLDASGIGWLDYTGAGAVAEVHRALAARGVALHLAAVRQEAAEVLARTRQGAWLAANGRLHADVGAAVSALGLDPESPLLPPALAAPPEGV